MKTIDTKSVVIGVLITLLLFTLTSGKMSSEDDNLASFSFENKITIFNKQTKMLYMYPFNMKLEEKPWRTYKVSSDGSSITKMDD